MTAGTFCLFCVHLTLKNLQKINAEEDKERKKKQMFLHGMLAHLEIPDTPEQPDVFHFRIVVVVYCERNSHVPLFLSQLNFILGLV